MSSDMNKYNLLMEIIKLMSIIKGAPVVIAGWEVLDFGVIVDYYEDKWESNGFCRLSWEDFPPNVNQEVFKSFGQHRVAL